MPSAGVEQFAQIAVVPLADVGVRIAEFAQHLADKIIQILPRPDEWQQLAIET